MEFKYYIRVRIHTCNIHVIKKVKVGIVECSD